MTTQSTDLPLAQMSSNDLKSKLRIAGDSRTAFTDTLSQMPDYIDFLEEMLKEYLDAANKLENLRLPSDGSNEKLGVQLKDELMYCTALNSLFYGKFKNNQLTFDQLKKEVAILSGALRDNNLKDLLGSSGMDLGPRPPTHTPTSQPKPPQEPKKPKTDAMDDYDHMSPEELQRLIDEMEKKEQQEKANKSARNPPQHHMQPSEYNYESGNNSPRYPPPQSQPQKPADRPLQQKPAAANNIHSINYGDKHHSLQPSNTSNMRPPDNPFKPHGTHSLGPRDTHSPSTDGFAYGRHSDFNHPHSLADDPRRQDHSHHHLQAKSDPPNKSALSPFGEQLMRGITAILEMKSKKEQQKSEIGNLFGGGILDKMVSEDNRQQLDADRMKKLELLLIRDENQLEKLKIDNEVLKETEHTFKGRLTGMKNLNHIIRADVASISEVIESKEQEKSLLKKDIDMLEQELVDIEREITQTQATVDAQQDPYLDLRHQKAKYRKELQLLDIDIQKFKTGYESLKRRWDDELKGLNTRSDPQGYPQNADVTANHSIYSDADFIKRKLDFARDNLDASFSRILDRNDRSVSPVHNSLNAKDNFSNFDGYQQDPLKNLSDYRHLSYQSASPENSFRQSTSYAERYLSKDFKRHY